MKFTVARDVLADAVGWAVRAVPSRPVAPVLVGLRLVVSGAWLRVTGFDGETSAAVEVPVDPGSDGVALVHGPMLAGFVKALPDRPVQVAATASELEVACGAGSFALPLMPAQDHPGAPAGPPAAAGTVDAAELAAAVGRVAGSASRDEAVPVLTAVHVRGTSTTLALVATDRYRLAAAELPWRPRDDAPLDALVPARVLIEAARALGQLGGDVVLSGGDPGGAPLLALGRPDRSITTRLFDGVQYPPVHRLLDVPRPVLARARTAELREAVRRVALAAERLGAVRLTFDRDHVVVEARGAHDARAREELPARLEGAAGASLTVALNPEYLLEGLHGLAAPVAVLAFVDGAKPPLLTGEDDGGRPVPGFRYLVQPVRGPRA